MNIQLKLTGIQKETDALVLLNSSVVTTDIVHDGDCVQSKNCNTAHEKKN